MKKFLSVLFLIIILFSQAQPVDPPADNDLPAANIDTLLILGQIIAILLGYYFLKETLKSKNKI